MNVLDIEYIIKLDQAKTRPNSIDSINRLSKEILKEASGNNGGAERYRFWHKKLKKLHPLVDRYLSGQFEGSDLSDVTGEHILNLNSDTQTVDLKYYYPEVKNSSGTPVNNGIAPIPIRSSIRHKIPEQQLKMTEQSYFDLNEPYSIIMSTFFKDDSKRGDPDKWVISRQIAHEYYNTQDYLGFSVKLFLYDSQVKTLVGKYENKLQLLDTITPISEKFSVEYENIVINVEGKQMAIDKLGNKIIRMPSTVDASILNPTPLT